MHFRKFVLLTALTLLAATLPLLADQPLPSPPAGFTPVPIDPQIQAMKDAGQADMISAEKSANSTCSDVPKIALSYGWQVAPLGFDRVWELMKQSPEESVRGPVGMGPKDEPAGKGPYKGGVLEWRKLTRVLAGSCVDSLTNYQGSWTAFLSGKIVTVRVANVDSKAAGQPWIDAYVDRVAAVAASASVQPRIQDSVRRYVPTGFEVDERQFVTQSLGAYKITQLNAQRSNQLVKPFVSPEESDLQLRYTEILESSFGPQMWQQVQKEAEKDSQEASDSDRTFIGKEVAGTGTIYWYKLDSLTFLPRRLRTGAGEKPSMEIYDATFIRQDPKGILTVKITSYVGDRALLRQCFAQR